MNENQEDFDVSAVTAAQWELMGWAMRRGGLKEYDQWLLENKKTDDNYQTRQQYILDIAGTIDSLGMGNIYEPQTLFVEPANNFTKAETNTILHELSGGMDASLLQKMNIDVLDPTLVKQYSSLQAFEVGAGYSAATVAASFVPTTKNNGAVLFDPLYGMALVPKDGGWRQVCFADGLWNQRIIGMPEHFIQQHLKNVLLSLSEGVLIGQHTMFPIFPDDVKRGFEELRVPELVIQTPRELYAIIDNMQNEMARSGAPFQFWFRGQPTDYLVPDRSLLINNGMARYCSVRDSSLAPSIFRQIDQYTAEPTQFMKLVRHIGDWSINAKQLLPPAVTILDIKGEAAYQPKKVPPKAQSRMSMYMAGKPHLDIPSLRDLGPYTLWEILGEDGEIIDAYIKLHHPSLQGSRVMLLLQHYGCPTPYIDITHDPIIALWFALHKLSTITPGKLNARRVDDIRKDPRDWPTIYVFTLNPKDHPVVDTSAILANSQFLRPQVQKCGLLGGGGNLARNYPARYIAVKLRLGPEFLKMPLPAVQDIFPAPDKDAGLRELLAAESSKHNDRLFPVYVVS